MADALDAWLGGERSSSKPTGWLWALAAMLVLAAPFVLLLLVVLWMCWAHENRVIVTHLADEEAEVCSPGTIQELVPARRRSMRWG